MNTYTYVGGVFLGRKALRAAHNLRAYRHAWQVRASVINPTS